MYSSIGAVMEIGNLDKVTKTVDKATRHFVGVTAIVC